MTARKFLAVFLLKKILHITNINSNKRGNETMKKIKDFIVTAAIWLLIVVVIVVGVGLIVMRTIHGIKEDIIAAIIIVAWIAIWKLICK